MNWVNYLLGLHAKLTDCLSLELTITLTTTLTLITSHYTAVNYTYMRSEVYCTKVLITSIAMPFT